MVCGNFLFFIGNDAASFLRTDSHFDKRSLDIFLGYKNPIRFGSQNCRLIQKVLQIRPCEACGSLGNLL